MRIILTGAGELGRLVVESLVEMAHDVTVIDDREDVCSSVADEYDVMVLCGDVTRPDVLERAGIEKADLVIALTEDDKQNLITALIAKEYGVERVMVKLDDSGFNIVCHKLGIEEIISPRVATARLIASMVRRHHALEMSTLVGGTIRVFTATIRKPEHIGKRIEELELPDDSLPVVVERRGEFFIAKPDIKLLEGDHLDIICEENTLDILSNIFSQ